MRFNYGLMKIKTNCIFRKTIKTPCYKIRIDFNRLEYVQINCTESNF